MPSWLIASCFRSTRRTDEIAPLRHEELRDAGLRIKPWRAGTLLEDMRSF